MKKFFALFIFVFAGAAFAQSGPSQSSITDETNGKTSIADSSKYTAEETGDLSVARVLDDEFAQLGYSDPARLSILGDVGRENNWNRNIIFKGHSDPKNRAYNRGIIS